MPHPEQDPVDAATAGLRGSLPALVTPLTPDRQVATGEVAGLVTRALGDGASGVLVAGSTGEGALLEPAQRVDLVEHARAALDEHRRAAPADARCPVLVAGASAPTVKELHADVARLGASGADLVLVLAPSTYPLTSDELLRLHLDVAERSSTPTLVYHIPQLTGSALQPEAIRTLAAQAGVVGMKDSSPDADRRAAFATEAAAADGRFEVVTGHAPTLRTALEAGVAGSITAIANVRQRTVVRLHEAVAAGDGQAVATHQDTLTRVTEGLGRVGTSMPAALKAAMQLDGVLVERWCRPPLGSVPADRLDRVRSALLR